MLTPKLQMLQRTLKRLIRRGASGPLERVLQKTHAADLAYLVAHFSDAERAKLVERCGSDARRAQVLAETDPAVAASYLATVAPPRAVELLNLMPPDDVSDILEEAPAALSEELLRLMRSAARTTIEDLSRYDSSTAGGIMSPRFFALPEETTAREAIAALQRDDTNLEMVFYVYVTNEHGQLQGVVSLRQLVTTKPDRKLKEIMTTDLICVGPDEDQEEVAKLASRYGLLAIPVRDAGKLIGIVTVDDVIDVLHEEHQEDLLRMAGAGDDLLEHKSLWVATLRRFPWLLSTSIGGVISAVLLAAYAEKLTQYLPLVCFIPIVLGLSRVVGRQSATILSRIITQGKLGLGLVWQLLRQALVGALLGAVYGGLVGALAWFWWMRGPLGAAAPRAALVLGLGIVGAMTAAAVLGAGLPILFQRIRVDLAHATGPLVSTAVDLVGLLLYLSIATLI